jgi:hypothetical protein
VFVKAPNGYQSILAIKRFYRKFTHRYDEKTLKTFISNIIKLGLTWEKLPFMSSIFGKLTSVLSALSASKITLEELFAIIHTYEKNKGADMYTFFFRCDRNRMLIEFLAKSPHFHKKELLKFLSYSGGMARVESFRNENMMNIDAVVIDQILQTHKIHIVDTTTLINTIKNHYNQYYSEHLRKTIHSLKINRKRKRTEQSDNFKQITALKKKKRKLSNHLIKREDILNNNHKPPHILSGKKFQQTIKQEDILNNNHKPPQILGGKMFQQAIKQEQSSISQKNIFYNKNTTVEEKKVPEFSAALFPLKNPCLLFNALPHITTARQNNYFNQPNHYHNKMNTQWSEEDYLRKMNALLSNNNNRVACPSLQAKTINNNYKVRFPMFAQNCHIRQPNFFNVRLTPLVVQHHHTLIQKNNNDEDSDLEQNNNEYHM